MDQSPPGIKDAAAHHPWRGQTLDRTGSVRYGSGMDDLRTHQLGSGFVFQWEPTYQVDLPDLPLLVSLTVDVEDDRLVVTDLTARRRPGGRPVTVDALRALPLARMTALAVTQAARNGFGNVGRDWSEVTDADALGDLEQLPVLDRVAVAYRWGYFIGENPTKWVAKVLSLGQAVAAKRVQAARLAGLLEPTTRGRKGT